MNHAYHHMRLVFAHVAAQRDLSVLGAPNQSALHTTNEPIASVQTLQDLWYYQLWVTVVIPILLVVGISNNVLVIAGFSQRVVKRSVHRRLGVFYRLIAAFDIWVMFTKDFVYYWLEDGLALTTGGHWSLLTRTRSSFWCKLLACAWDGGIVCADYTLASLSIERALVVCFPLLSKTFMTNRWAYIQTLMFVLINFIPTVTLTGLINNVVTINNAYSICSPAPSDMIMYNIYAWLGCFTYYFFHAVLMLASSVSISVKLAMAVRSKRALTQMSGKGGEKTGAGAGGSRREMQAAITVCTIAFMQCLAYFPTAVTCMAVCLANESPQFALEHPDLYSLISVSFDMGSLTFSVAHVWNFYIYMLRVPSFRACVLRWLRCGRHCAGDSLPLNSRTSASTNASDYESAQL